MKRREFIMLGGGAAAAWPLAARAQQAAMPVIGFLSALSEGLAVHHLAMFRRGLNEVGFVEGQNVAIEFRWADGQNDRLPALAAELVRRPVNLIVAQAPSAALAGRAATTTIPIVFAVSLDPVEVGLVASFNRPGGNATGMAIMSTQLAQKRLELARELVPKAAVAPMLVNPLGSDAAPEIRSVQEAAQANGLQLRILNASTSSELDAAFAALAERRPDVLLVAADPVFMIRREEIVARVARLAVPAAYPDVGGLISFGPNLVNTFRQVGIYAGRILKGAKPADLPVMQPTTFELVINLKTAKSLGFEIPATLHARSDEVIE